ncbi:MAG: dephospho-CoA kinase [Oscillospiraceae bacterium]|nr:dephospho-CoA kinase [Oscillospiraceae bacterium]
MTGHSGSGKTIATSFFEKKGFYCINADLIWHKILLENDFCKKEIIYTFGNIILNKSDVIDRKILANIVFSNGNLLKKLNFIAFKYIKKKLYL